MGPAERRVVPLSDARSLSPAETGHKAANLARLIETGFRVPGGFCVTTAAYAEFLETNRLAEAVEMEIGRKSLEDSRWEEIWDAALRIRSAFLAATVPDDLAGEIFAAAAPYRESPLAVRSSAPGEDSGDRSFAGLHESVLGVVGEAALLDAVRLVWASLWSDAALLYRGELGLDPAASRMAVVVQPVVETAPSGVAFARDPRDPGADRMVIEAVPGPCGDLVDGRVDPDRWILLGSSGEVISWRSGRADAPLLADEDLERLRTGMVAVEGAFGWPPDMEWTGRGEDLTLLQARPITPPAESKDRRQWYLTLRPDDDRLRDLAKRVSEERIPELEAIGERLAAADLGAMTDSELSAEMESRRELLERWRKIYEEDFIPFAHGVRRLATYYQEAVRPEDPYEFVGLLTGQELLAFRRNRDLADLADRLRTDPGMATDEAFLAELQALAEESFDVEYQGVRLSRRSDLLLPLLVEMSERDPGKRETGSGEDLERKLLDAVGPDRHGEATEMIELGRLSWRLRDDDNILIGRVESQFLRAVAEGEARGLPVPDSPDPMSSTVVATRPRPEGEKPRQLVGQPSSPGIATGPVRRMTGPEDLGRFRAGDVLVCDAIQPTITHVVPLASAVVERRGGMLIHGAIVARELGIPCVNGIEGVVDLLEDGEKVTVDGWLGIVTVGEAEFDLEV